MLAMMLQLAIRSLQFTMLNAQCFKLNDGLVVNSRGLRGWNATMVAFLFTAVRTRAPRRPMETCACIGRSSYRKRNVSWRFYNTGVKYGQRQASGMGNEAKRDSY